MKETKFKNTEIGKIPEEWRICNFGDIFTFFSNNTLSRDMLGERGVCIMFIMVMCLLNMAALLT